MKRRTLLKALALAILGYVVPRFSRAQAGAVGVEDRDLIAAIGEVVLPTALGTGRRGKAVDAFVNWLDKYQAGGSMSYGYGHLRYAVVPPSPMLRYPAQIERLQQLSKAKGSLFAGLSASDKTAVVEVALREAGVTELPERPDGHHLASDLMSHFYNSSDGNDFLFNASIGVLECRGLESSTDRPASIV